MMKRLYKILGVESNTSKSEIKKAYRKKAKQTHPDKPTGNKEKFAEIALAYRILSDDDSRQHYDQTGDERDNTARRRQEEFENSIFSKLVEVFCTMDCSSKDPLVILSDGIRGQIKNIQKESEFLKGQLIKLTKNLKRLMIKDTTVFPTLEQRFTLHQQAMESKIEFNEKKIAILEEFIIKLKQGIEFLFEKQPERKEWHNSGDDNTVDTFTSVFQQYVEQQMRNERNNRF